MLKKTAFVLFFFFIRFIKKKHPKFIKAYDTQFISVDVIHGRKVVL